MELRRALLLFAIVLGLAAIATSVSRPDEETSEQPPAARGAAPSVSPGADAPPADAIAFARRGRPRAKRLQAGTPATVTVDVREPGQVEIAGLGLSSPAQPLTAARFEVLAAEPARHEVRFTPSAGGEPRTIGTLVIEPHGGDSNAR